MLQFSIKHLIACKLLSLTVFLFTVDYVGPDSCYVDKAFYFLIHYKNDRLFIAVGCLETAKMNQLTC